jgi:hypothetical protein
VFCKIKIKTVGGGPTASNFFVFDGAVALQDQSQKMSGVARHATYFLPQ